MCRGVFITLPKRDDASTNILDGDAAKKRAAEPIYVVLQDLATLQEVGKVSRSVNAYFKSRHGLLDDYQSTASSPNVHDKYSTHAAGRTGDVFIRYEQSTSRDLEKG